MLKWFDISDDDQHCEIYTMLISIVVFMLFLSSTSFALVYLHLHNLYTISIQSYLARLDCFVQLVLRCTQVYLTCHVLTPHCSCLHLFVLCHVVIGCIMLMHTLQHVLVIRHAVCD